MSLREIKEVNMTHSDTKEKIETLTYSPGLQGTGDLEPATKTITATSKPATADYSQNFTLSKPSDARLQIKRIAHRLQVTRDSGTSANLYCTVSVDSADGSANIIFNAVDVQAAALQATGLSSGSVFNLLSDGQVHTFYFFFWVNSGDSVISLVRFWEGLGSNHTTYYPIGNCAVLQINHTGFIGIITLPRKIGTGTSYMFLAALVTPNTIEEQFITLAQSNKVALSSTQVIAKDGLLVCLYGTVTTDLNYFAGITVILRSEQ